MKLLVNQKPADCSLLPGLLALFIPTFHKLITVGWKSADYSHAYFILPISLFLIYRDRQHLERSDGINKHGLALFIWGILTHVFGARTDFMFIEASSFVFTVWGIFLLKFTYASFKRNIFPLVYLLFLVPPPQLAIDMLSMPLK